MTHPWINDVPGAWEVFTDHPVVLLLMPLIGGFIGWSTKLVAIEMLFRPLEFKGIGPFGWQGQLPKQAAKFGSHAAEIMLGNVIDPRELIDRLEPVKIAAELDDILVAAVDEIARDVMGDGWGRVPATVRAAVLARARGRAPEMIGNLLGRAKDNIDELFDLGYMVTSRLVNDKALLIKLLRGPLKPIFTFMKNFGLLFGFIVGFIQMVVFAFTESHLLIPLFGLFVGLFSDYLALQMLFAPTKPRRYLGAFTWYGLMFRERDNFARQYAKLAATEILTPAVMIGAVLDGPLADRLVEMVRAEVEAALSDELGAIEPLVPAAIGTVRYQSLRRTIVGRAQQRMHEASRAIDPYMFDALDIEHTIVSSLAVMTNEELIEMMRPVFKDDEWLVVALGGGLGFGVGELQVRILTSLGGL